MRMEAKGSGCLRQSLKVIWESVFLCGPQALTDSERKEVMGAAQALGSQSSAGEQTCLKDVYWGMHCTRCAYAWHVLLLCLESCEARLSHLHACAVQSDSIALPM